MPAPWYTDGELKQALADVLRKSVEALDPLWDRHVEAGNHSATVCIRAALRARGYSPEQIAAAEQTRSLNRHLGLYFTLLDGASLDSDAIEKAKGFDRRAELLTVLLLVDGDAVVPAVATNGAGAGGGRMNETGWSVRTDTVF